MTITTLSRKNIQALTPYQSARRLGGKGNIWLNANEYPSSPNFSLTKQNFNRYPEAQPSSLIEACAQYTQLLPENILVTRGGDESIELIIRAFCEPGQDAILYCPPTYGMYAVSAESCGITRKTVPLIADFQLNLTEIENQLDNVKIVFVCSPNNPTGNTLNRQDLITLLNMTKDRAIVVLDEAYIEFCQESTMITELNHYPHLAIIRTLSKAFALAGLRCGFTLANPEMIGILQKVIAPYPLPTPVIDIATQALSTDGIAMMQQRVETIKMNRNHVLNALRSFDFIKKIYPSETNYLLFHAQNGQQLFEFLWEKGIILRNQNNQLGLTDCIRMTIGSEEENQQVIAAMAQFAQQG